jgi:hypothetical protein
MSSVRGRSEKLLEHCVCLCRVYIMKAQYEADLAWTGMRCMLSVLACQEADSACMHACMHACVHTCVHAAQPMISQCVAIGNLQARHGLHSKVVAGIYASVQPYTWLCIDCSAMAILPLSHMYIYIYIYIYIYMAIYYSANHSATWRQPICGYTCSL